MAIRSDIDEIRIGNRDMFARTLNCVRIFVEKLLVRLTSWSRFGENFRLLVHTFDIILTKHIDEFRPFSYAEMPMLTSEDCFDRM